MENLLPSFKFNIGEGFGWSICHKIKKKFFQLNHSHICNINWEMYVIIYDK